MSLDFDAACAAVMAAVPAAERAVAAVSLDPKPYARGEDVGIDREFRPADAPLWLGFIDLQPDRNWGHRALTVIIREGGAVEIREAQFPPALKDGRRLLPVIAAPK